MTPETIPYIVHEGMMARQERTIRRLWILCLVIFLAFAGSNAQDQGRRLKGIFANGGHCKR